MLKFLANVLKNHLIKTSVNGLESSCTKVENGIVQGAVISPTLLNIAFYDINKVLPPEVLCVISVSYTHLDVYKRQP